MWVVTDRRGEPVAQVEPSRGHHNLFHQLKLLGLLQHTHQLKGLGTARYIVDEFGAHTYNVVKIPYVPMKLRKAGRGVLLKPLDFHADVEDDVKAVDQSNGGHNA